MKINEIALNNAGNGMESMGALSSHVCKRIILSQKRLKLIYVVTYYYYILQILPP